MRAFLFIFCFFLCLPLLGNTIPNDCSLIVEKIKKDTSVNVKRHSIFAEFWGPGLHGGIGYNYIFTRTKNFDFEISAGVGAVIEEMNPFTAGLLFGGANSNFCPWDRWTFSLGLYTSNYFNYWGLIKHNKDCYGTANCPPNYDNFLTPKLGVSYNFFRFSIELNCYRFLGFWAYDSFLPSLKIKMKL